jgi:hypothetical protein
MTVLIVAAVLPECIRPSGDEVESLVIHSGIHRT